MQDKNRTRSTVSLRQSALTRFLFLLWGASYLFPPHAHAAAFGGQTLVSGLEFMRQALSGSGIATQESLRSLIIKILVIVLYYVTLLAVAMIIIAGLYLIVSNGDEGNKDKAKKIITYTSIGLVVILLSRVIVAFVNSLF